MNSNLIMSISRMMSQSMGNPQAMAQNILRQNPQFAKMIEGQNLPNMAQQMLRQQGIDPNMLQSMLNKK